MNSEVFVCRCVPYVPDPENTEILKNALKIYLRFGKRIDALRTAIMLNDRKQIAEIFFGCPDS